MRLESVQWWHSLADSSFVRYDFAGIESVTAPAGKPAVHQSNSSAAAVTLSRAGQEPLAVIVKSVNLDENLCALNLMCILNLLEAVSPDQRSCARLMLCPQGLV